MRRLALCIALWPALAGCHREAVRPNLLLVSIDTLRADRLGSYGYASAETPRLDALAARGWRFTQAATVVPLTLPAHSSLLTGTFPAHHGVRDNGGFYLGDEQTTLAETLKAQGYRTGAFVGSFVLDGRWGTSQGFDRYFDEFDLSKYDGVGMDAVQRRGDEVVDQAARWLGEESSAPFFAWVHLYDPHTPYNAPEPFRSRHTQDIPGAYDAEVAWTDSLVGRLLDGLAARGVESFEVHYYLGRALSASGKAREAIPHFEAAIVRLPGFAAAYLELAQCRIALGDAPGAVEVLRRGQAAAPKDPRLHEREAQVWKRGQRHAQAIAAYRAAIALAPKDALLRVQLGEALRDAGALDDAARSLREAVALDPAPASYWNALGMVLGAAGRLADAEGAFREALSRDAANAQYAYNAGLAAFRLGRAAEARSLYEEALRRDPSFAPARAGLHAPPK